MVYFVLIYSWLHSRIDTFGANLMGAVTSWMSALALVLVTIWIMIQGYRILTGQMRESMAGLVTNMVRVVVIVTVATAFGVAGPNLHTLVTTELSTDINQLFTGDNQTAAQSIDRNLASTALAMAAIQAVQAPPSDAQTVADKSRAIDLAIFGTASPPMAAGAMLLLYSFTIALFVGLGPFFSGWVYDATGSYELVMIGGIVVSIAGALLLLSLGRYPDAVATVGPAGLGAAKPVAAGMPDSGTPMTTSASTGNSRASWRPISTRASCTLRPPMLASGRAR